MRSQPHISADATVEDVVSRHPATARVFVRRRMPCPGCYLAPFHTIAEACAIYRQPLELVLRELRQAAAEVPALRRSHVEATRETT